jgi:hypothetical protein
MGTLSPRVSAALDGPFVVIVMTAPKSRVAAIGIEPMTFRL